MTRIHSGCALCILIGCCLLNCRITLFCSPPSHKGKTSRISTQSLLEEYLLHTRKRKSFSQYNTIQRACIPSGPFDPVLEFWWKSSSSTHPNSSHSLCSTCMNTKNPFISISSKLVQKSQKHHFEKWMRCLDCFWRRGETFVEGSQSFCQSHQDESKGWGWTLQSTPLWWQNEFTSLSRVEWGAWDLSKRKWVLVVYNCDGEWSGAIFWLPITHHHNWSMAIRTIIDRNYSSPSLIAHSLFSIVYI